MKRIIKILLVTFFICMPLGANAQGVITRSNKPKKQTTAPTRKTSKKKKQLTAEQMHIKGIEARNIGKYSEAEK